VVVFCGGQSRPISILFAADGAAESSCFLAGAFLLTGPSGAELKFGDVTCKATGNGCVHRRTSVRRYYSHYQQNHRELECVVASMENYAVAKSEANLGVLKEEANDEQARNGA